MSAYHNPLVLQRADPWVIRHRDLYYFTASYPAYDRIILRAAARLNDLQAAPERTIWRKHESGPMSRYISLDATTTVIGGSQYLIWAQKDPAIEGNSNLYIARMANPWTLATDPVMLSKPEYDWECIDFKVNEGPAVLLHQGVIYLTYSASGTGVPYAVGMLTAREDADLLDPASWTKSDHPVFKTAEENHQYGPGHNCFTVSEDGSQDLIVYHARNYTHIEGDPLFDPNRHARVGLVTWTDHGPDFGRPLPDDRWTPTSRQILPPDGSH